MIFDDKSDWFDLSNFSDDEELPYAPTELWVLNLFIAPITINERTYIPIIYPSYTSKSINGKLSESEGIWSTPYSADKIELGPFSHSLIGKIRKLYGDYFQDASRVEKSINDSLYHIGLQSLSIKEIGSYLEYKKSPRRGDVWKCYYVKYLFINDLDFISKKNLIDPACIRGMNFIDFKNYKKYTTPNPSYHHKIYYKGRLLSTNLSYLLRNNTLSPHLSCCSKIDNSLLSIKEHGVIVSVDMLKFGQLNEHIIDGYGSLKMKGTQVAHQFIQELRELFIDFLEQYGFFQYKIDGDGFLATCPFRPYNQDKVKQVANATKMLGFLVKAVNKKLSNTDITLNWRASIIIGEYNYGKISSILSTKPEHFGESLITLSRLLESSRDIEHKLKNDEYTITFLSDQYHTYKKVIDSLNYQRKIERNITVKEYTNSVITLILTK